MFGGRPSLRSAQKGHTTFLDPETLSLLRSGPRNRWEGLLIGDCVVTRHSATILSLTTHGRHHPLPPTMINSTADYSALSHSFRVSTLCEAKDALGCSPSPLNVSGLSNDPPLSS